MYGLPELHRAELAGLRDASARIVGSPGCYATAAILALAPRQFLEGGQRFVISDGDILGPAA